MPEPAQVEQSATGSRTRLGLSLGTGQYEAEANAYFQDRLKIGYGVATVAVISLFLVDEVVLAFRGSWSMAGMIDPPHLVHLVSAIVVTVIFVLLCRRSFGERGLKFLDALAVQLAIAACLLIYALIYDQGPRSMIGILSIFMISRAVVIPSRAVRTFLLSLPAAIGILVIQLAYGSAYAYPGHAFPQEFFHDAVMVWDQAILLFAVAVATVASRVNFSLRARVAEVRRLGQYHLDEKLGEGGMGEVYRATHAMLRRPTAIKLLRPEITGEEALARFEREVRQTSRLTHPNTVAIFDYGRTPEGVFYYAMEYLDGADLRRIVNESGPMPVARALTILVQACGALNEAHSLGLVHRDIKPSNLLVTRQGGEWDVAKLLDFGLVKDVTSSDRTLTRLGSICGTPETLAPEVLGGEAASPASDLYALAVVGYFMLTGRPIFEARTVAEFVGHHLHSPPIPLRTRDPSLPDDVEAALLRCLSKDPAERPADAAELRAELRRCADWGSWSEEDANGWWARYRDGQETEETAETQKRSAGEE